MALAYEIGSADGACAPRSWQNYLAEDQIDESATAIGAAWRLNGRRTYCLRYHCREALLSVQAQ